MTDEGCHESSAFFGAGVVVEVYGILSIGSRVGDTSILSSGVSAVFELFVGEVVFMERVDDSISCVVGGMNFFV